LRREEFAAEYWNDLYNWFDHGGHEIVAGYLAGRDLSGFDAKKPPPKTVAWQRMVNMSRATEDAELADALERMGNPDAVTISGCAPEPSSRFLIILATSETAGTSISGSKSAATSQ